MREVLADKQIVLAVTGSIAAVEDVKLAHSLRRHGALVQGVMSSAACGIISPEAITYATGRPTITSISGMVEHVTYCGIGGSADLLLIAPCTANTICKIAAGIDDTPVTTFATTAIGRRMPIVIVPAMHESMYCHPAVMEAIRKLEDWGIDFVDPRMEEDKAKLASIEEIILHTERALSGKPLSGRRVLVTGGPCREPLDDVRVLTTRSSGRMGQEIALEAFRLGAEVSLVHTGPALPCVKNIHAESATEMRKAVLSVLSGSGADFYVSAAAISDFAPERTEGKIPSGEPVSINLCPLPKLIDKVIRDFSPVTVAFKLGWDAEERAKAMLKAGASMVVANTPENLGTSSGSVVLLTPGRRLEISGDKQEIAAAIWSELL